ncbi:MAG TPA: metalloregulator ArsR/SmtB family transcription factor [Polyangia bacterium]|jgi:ArsR family transcriptional regulator
MNLAEHVDTLNLLGDESRIRLCVLLRERELCVSDLVRATGIAQSRVSTHLGRLREAGFVRDRRQGAQSFYALATDSLPLPARAILADAAGSTDPTLEGDQKRLSEIELERRDGLPESAVNELERDYSPGRTWHSLALGLGGFLRLGDVLDAGSGDGAAASTLAPHCRSLTCIDTNPHMIELARERLARFPHARAQVADLHELPFEAASFDAVLMFHTLTYAAHPARALAECARVLRPGGRLVLLCLDEHRQLDVTARYGERHPGFSPRAVRALITRAGLTVVTAEIACRELKKPRLQVVLGIADKPHSKPRKANMKS